MGEIPQPLSSYRSMLEAEVSQAVAELRRPSAALFASGITAGICVGTSVMLMGAIAALSEGELNELTRRFLYGNAYALGFVLAILGRSDLFTEYTTIAVFPVLTSDCGTSDLARLWGLIYLGNLVGGTAIAALAVLLGPALGFAEAEALAAHATELVAATWWAILASAALAGWLMGLLSWLIAGGRDTTSQFLFIWLTGLVIGVLGLHHVITGGIELIAGLMTEAPLGWSDAAYFLVWTTLGNALGGVIFAWLMLRGVQIHPEESGARDREEGRAAQRQRSW